MARRRTSAGAITNAADTDSAAVTSRLLLALLTLAVDERERHADETPNQVKSEVLLARAGLSSSVIAELVQKQPGAVRTTLSRAKVKKAR
jgi:DNA-directed RNA polymerase specialized sigma24 family protein